MNVTTHPAVARYLDDLGRMLGDLEPGERAEVLAGVREHIEEALGDRPHGSPQEDDAAVAAVLTELGPPDVIAQAAYADRAAPADDRSATRVPLTSRAWVPVVVAVLQALSLLLVILVVGASVGWVEESSTTSGGETVVRTMGGSSIAAALAGGLVALPLWIVIALLVGLSALWTAREKVTHLLVVPVSALLFAAGPSLGWSLGGPTGMVVSAWTVLTLVVAGGGWLLYRLTVSARRRASAAR